MLLKTPEDFLPHIYVPPFAYVPLNDAKSSAFREWTIKPVRDKQYLAQYLASGGAVGIVLGPPSGNVICIDLDHFTDEMYGIANIHLPRTSLMAGREGDTERHRLYRIEKEDYPDDLLPGQNSAIRKLMDRGEYPRFPGKKSFKGIYREKKYGIDLLAAGSQVGVAPSIYRKDGDKIIRREWRGGVPFQPPLVKFSELLECVHKLHLALGGKVKPTHNSASQVVVSNPNVQAAGMAPDLPSDLSGFVVAIRNMTPAIQGQGGNSKTFAACCLAGDYNVPIEQAWPALQAYNKTCVPPWDEAELYKKLQDSYLSRNQPTGYKVQQQSEDWRKELIYVYPPNKTSYPKSNNLVNATLFIKNLPELKGRIQYDEFLNDIVITGDLPWRKL